MVITIGSWWEDFDGTFIFATLAKFILVVELESSMDVNGSLVFVNTSTIDVVRIFEANGLYSPVFVAFVGVLVVDDDTTSNEDDTGDEIESDEETFGIVEDNGAGIRWPGWDGTTGTTGDGWMVVSDNEVEWSPFWW
jgi:hypothetical protein